MTGIRRRLGDTGVEVRLYGAFAVLLLGGALGYAIWSSWDPPGTILLLLAAGLFVIVSGYLAFQERLARTATDDERPVAAAEEPYLPHASIWPLELGAGMTLTLAGLAMGRWVLIPGLVLIVHSLAGWLMQSRRRDPH